MVVRLWYNHFYTRTLTEGTFRRNMPAKPRVFLIDAAESPLCTDTAIEAEVLRDHAELIFVQTTDSETFPPEVVTAEALIVSHFPRISERLLATLPNCRMVVRNGVGYDNVDTEAARRHGIAVCNVPDYGTEEVADFAILQTLALQRNLCPSIQDVRQGNWNWRIAEPGRRLRGQRFGLIGCGRIGTATALRAKALNFMVQFYDPYITAGYEKALGVGRVASLEELLERSDTVSLHCPLNALTRGMIGARELRLMRRGAFLVNTARGALIQEAALIDALRSGHLGGAALDVLEDEPRCAPELLAFANCLVTPHVAFYSADAVDEMRGNAARNVARCLQGADPVNIVNQVLPGQARLTTVS
jgi:phosphoglycerate dehydrogenase-like enzyme